jgi:hypothetical protein
MEYCVMLTGELISVTSDTVLKGFDFQILFILRACVVNLLDLHSYMWTLVGKHPSKLIS